MSTAGTITDDNLTALAGENAFERGLAYFEQGRVESWRVKGHSITAQVSGSELYQVTLGLAGQRLEGYCDCPASEGFDFCKHCVAAALQYREDSERQAQLEHGSTEQRIEAHLNTLGKQELLQQLLQLIVADPELSRQWSITADVALNRMDARAIKKRLTAAIPYNRHLHRHAQVRVYFSKLAPVLELLEQQLPQLEAASGLQLVEYALQRLQRALETIDDSGGFRLQAMTQLQNLHQALLWRLDWDKPKLVAYLQALDLGPCTDMYPEFPHAYRDVLGEEGMALVYAALQAEWDALPPLPAGAGWEQRYPYSRLQQLLRQRAEQAGDGQAIIVLLQKTATDERHFLELCDLCMAQGDWEQVERYLAAARTCQPPGRAPWNREYRLERTEQRLLVQRGDLETALALQWRIFQGSLALEDYLQLLDLAASCGTQENHGDTARRWLRGKLADAEQNPFSSRYADALLEIAMHENRLGMALEVATQYAPAAGLIAKLARACRGSPEAAMPLYARLVALEVQQGKRAAYRRGVAWMLEAQELAVTETGQRMFLETLEAVRERFKARRSFVQFLNEAFY